MKKKTQKKDEVIEVETEVKTLTSIEILQKVSDYVKDFNPSGFVMIVVGSDGKILPWVGAKNIGDLLTMQYVLNKEITKLVDGNNKSTDQEANA